MADILNNKAGLKGQLLLAGDESYGNNQASSVISENFSLQHHFTKQAYL